jgi:integral membrane protein
MTAPALPPSVRRLLLVGLAEGASFLFLLGVAMPLKYAAGQPLFVKYGGWAHGLLFILFLMAIFQAWAERAISFKQAALAFAASLLPFGPFVLDRQLKKQVSA